MTALAGFWDLTGKDRARSACERMLAPQRIYGPDGDAVTGNGEIAVGRCLFDLLPEDEFDRGAVESGDGRFRLVGDVRLDNRDELAGLLGIADAARLPDAAFLAQAWARWEEDCFKYLYGDYAFAVWDVRQRRLVLARDHIGMRPMHYHRGRDFVAFASMPKGLHALPDVPYAPDEQRVAELLALLPEYGPRSFFKDICRVEGGHYVCIDADRVTAHRHWNPTPLSIGRWQGAAPVEALRAHLDRAVSVRLRGAGKNVGAHLSAGLDSSAVAATAARLMQVSDGTVTAFTSVPRRGYQGQAPEGRIGDEGPFARLTADLYPNIEHVLVASDGRPVDQNWDRNFYLLDRPLLNPSNQLWWDEINNQARKRGVRVMLSGEMGNMTLSFAGLERLPEMLWRSPLTWIREAAALVRRRRMRWRGALLLSVGPWIPKRLWGELMQRRGPAGKGIADYTALSPAQAARMNLDRLAHERDLDLAYRPRKNAVEARLWILKRTDRGNFQKAVLGGYGIDQRDPTSDRRLIEFCLSLPTREFLRDGRTRVLGEDALSDRLPAAVLKERRKGYQAVDWHEGAVAALGSLADEISRVKDLPAAASMLDLPRLHALATSPPKEGWNTLPTIRDYRLTLIRGGAIAHFLRRASRSNL